MNAKVIEVAGLYVSEQSRLVRLINRIVRNRAETEDLVHDAFIRLLNKSDLSAIQDRKAYLTRVAQNLAIDHKRRAREFVDLDDAALFALADSTPSLETALADRQTLVLTLKALTALPERTRYAFAMHRLGENTLVEIGRTLGISTAQAGRLVMDGYRSVRDRLRAQGVD